MQRYLTLLAVLLSLTLACSSRSGSTTAPEQLAPTASEPLPSSVAAVRTITRFPSVDTQPPTIAEFSLPESPRSPFPPYAERTAVLYDRHTNMASHLGAGSLGFFSPADSRYVWASGTTLHILHLPTLRSLEVTGISGVLAGFVDRRHLLVRGLEDIHVDTETGSVVASDWPPSRLPPAEIKLGLRLVGSRLGVGSKTFTVEDEKSESALLQIDGIAAAFGGPNEMVVAVAPEQGGAEAEIYLVNIATGVTEFVATAQLATVGSHPVEVLPLSAGPELVAWTERYCSATPTITIYSREKRSLTKIHIQDPVAVNDGWTRLSDDGLIGIGRGFVEGVFDITTRSWSLVLPPADQPDTAWSSDLRYVARGLVGGHGTGCPGT